MEKKQKIILASCAAVAVIVGAVAFTQGARLKAAASVAKSATMDEQQVTAKSDENAQITQEIQDEYQIPEITLTPEMQAAIADGSMTLEEAAAQLLSGGATQSETATEAEAEAETPNPESEAQASEAASEAQSAPESQPESVTPAPETPEPSQPESVTPAPEPSAPETATPVPEPEPPAPEPQKPTEPEPSKPEETASLSGEADSGRTEAQTAPAEDAGQTQAPEKSAEEKAKEEREAKVQSLFAQLYVLRDSFNARVDNIIAECIQEFLQLDPSKQTKVAKIRIVYSKMDTLEAMEADCNAQVESIASQLDEIDPALGEKARQYYQNEKELKKSSLIAQYGGG